jgi:pseudaminic acid biosynthesis-associated methylase
MKSGPISDWKGAFGDDYVERNAPSREAMAARLKMWSRILAAFADDAPSSILEVGCNLGLNLRALGQLSPARLAGLEPNAKARQRLIEDGVVPSDQVRDGDAAALPYADAAFDLVFTSGVLIHIDPERLASVYREIHRVSARFVLSVEYYSEQPMTTRYRGRDDLLFKRDFGTLWLESFPDLRIRDYGFFWRAATGLDNLNWWLLEKRR